MEKYTVGDELIVTSGNYEGSKVKVEEVGNVLRAIDSYGNFVPDGLATFESDIDSIQLPYTFDGKILKVQFPEMQFGEYTRAAYEMTSKFYGHYYDVRIINSTSNHLIRISEENLTPIL